MFRTEPRSKFRFVPRQAPRCYKYLLVHVGDGVDSGGGGSHKSCLERHECFRYNYNYSSRPKEAA